VIDARHAPAPDWETSHQAVVDFALTCRSSIRPVSRSPVEFGGISHPAPRREITGCRVASPIPACGAWPPALCVLESSGVPPEAAADLAHMEEAVLGKSVAGHLQ